MNIHTSNNFDIQAILNEMNDEDDDDVGLQYQDSMADLSSLSLGGATNALLFSPAQVAAAVTSSSTQQRLSYNKTAPINPRRKREIDIEQILRESDECDNVEDVVNALLKEHLPHDNAQFLLQERDDDGSTIESYSLHFDKIKNNRNVRSQHVSHTSNVVDQHQEASVTDEDEESASWGTGSATTTTATSDEEIGHFTKSTISTKVGASEQKNADSFAKASKKTLSKRATGDAVANNRDWAVLQSILAENDDNEEDDHSPPVFKMMGIQQHKSSPLLAVTDNNNKKTYYNYKKNNIFDVDVILQDDEDELEEKVHQLHSSTTENSKHDFKAAALEKSMVMPQLGPRAIPAKVQPVCLPARTTNTSSALTLTCTPTASISDSITAAAMAQAQLCETRLLHGHHLQQTSNATYGLVSPLSVKRRMKPKIELLTKSRQKQKSSQEQYQKQSSTGNRYDFSGGALNVTCLSQISNYMTQTSASALHNLPTALAVSFKFICIGTQSGYIYIYDMFQEKRHTLESSDGASVTSIDINGETLLLAGYSTGTIILWDAFTGKALKTCTDLHAANSPITLLRFLPNTSSSEDTNISNNNHKEDEGLRYYAAISVDASGLVNKLVFTKSLVGNLLLWGGIAGGYSVEVECLLDGSAGQILALEVLPSLSQIEKEWRAVYEKNRHFMKRVVLIALSSMKSSFVVAVEPTICVLHRWPKQEATEASKDNNISQENASYSSLLPCLSWGWSLVSGGGNIVHPILARSWGETLQLLRANYITPVNAPVDNENIPTIVDHDSKQWPAFGVLSDDEFATDSTIVSLHWINERSLAYLTSNCEFTVIDTVCMTLLERLDFSQHKLVYAALNLPSGGVSKTNATFANSIRSCIADQRLYITCQHALIQISLQSTKKLILDKEANGEWLQALALALDYYENYVQVLEDRLRLQDWDARGRDMRWHPELMRSGRMTDSNEWITTLLLRYLQLAIENAPINHTGAPRKPAGAATGNTNSRVDLTLSHYTMLAGICVEYCIGTRRLNVLYQQVYPTFLQSGYESVFYNVLEPYALRDTLKYMSPEVMAGFVEHCKINGGFENVERCLLHLDVTIMDFNSILPILKNNEMYSALLHVFTHGLDDYVTPFEILLEAVMDAFEEIAPQVNNSSRRLDGVFQNKFEHLGYKALLYLSYCFQGKAFPGGSKIDPVDRLQTLRPQLLHFLLQPCYNPSSSAQRSNLSHSFILPSSYVGRRADPYPYLSILVLVDAKAVLDSFSLVLDSSDATYEESSFDFQAEGGWDWDVMQPSPVALVDEEQGSKLKSNVCPDRQLMFSILAFLIRPTDASGTSYIAGTRQTSAAKNAFLDFIAKYLERGIIRVPKSLTHAVLTNMSHAAPQDHKVVEGSIIALIQALHPDAYDLEKIIMVMEGDRMSRAALLLHKIGADACFRAMAYRVPEGTSGSSDTWESSFGHFVGAIKSYINDSGKDASPAAEIFEYVKTYNANVQRLNDKVKAKYNINALFRRALLAIFPKLVLVDAVRSAQLVAERFLDDLEVIVDCLRKERGGEVLFDFFRAVISGQLSSLDSVSGSVFLANLNVDHYHLYLTLMAKLHPEMVYRHLLTQDSYRIEECLQLCQEFDIPDASSYMLERSGNISSAMELLLKTLDDRLTALTRVIRGMALTQTGRSLELRFSESLSRRDGRKQAGKDSFLQQQTAIQRIKQILAAALDLCERNSAVTGTEKRKDQGSQLWFNVLDRLVNAKGLLRISDGIPRQAELFSKILSDLLQLTMQRMVSNVSLPDLLQKITIDHSESRLGEFREMLMSMLMTYSGELDICSCALNIMHADKKRMSVERQKLKLRGIEVSSVSRQTQGSGLPSSDIPFHDSRIVIRVSNKVAMQDFSSITHSLPLAHATGMSTSADVSARLRKHRRRYDNIGAQCAISTKVSCMTLTDKQFSAATDDLSNSFVLGQQRHIGVLPDAEHFGSLSFLM